MTEQLCDVAVSLLARDKGFDEVCRATFEQQGDAYVPNETMTLKLADLSEDQRIHLVKRPGIWDGRECRNSKLPPWLLARPSQDLLARWLREKHGVYCVTEPALSAHGYPDSYRYYCLSKKYFISVEDKQRFDSWEHATEAALFLALNAIP